MAYYTEEQIKQARSIDLLTYLQTQEPTELVKLKGDTYCTREHDSLKISNGKWYWWSRGFGGNSHSITTICGDKIYDKRHRAASYMLI